ncbi:hypothetical protein Clacol_007575 [Clathrus columnatus]|uniref:BTB domain-containing protein n=1 Tax=Clathrus columnatus TaxID=1419009 RepID=A0AAV5AII2_9AGAM|nr:hypothetical protein Clacol_007575 [Clathrus columnatus]
MQHQYLENLEEPGTPRSILSVENTYFKIPRRKLVSSSLVFKGLLTLSPDWNEGKSEERPVVLEKVSSTDFERLLTYLYPLSTDYTRFTEGWDFDYWISILKVAHAYMMKDVYAQTIDMLNQLPFPDPFTRIQYGSRYDHSNWIRQGYRDLIQREEPLSIKEAHALGFEKAISCAAAREKYRPNRHYHHLDPLFSLTTISKRHRIDP